MLGGVVRKYAVVRFPMGVFDGPNRIADRVAKRLLAEHPEVDMIEVVEHGGWWLRFTRSLNGSEDVLLLCTANERGVPAEDALAYMRGTAVFEYQGDYEFPAV